MSRNAASSAVRKPPRAKPPAASAKALSPEAPSLEAPSPEAWAARLAPDDATPVASHVHDLQDLLARRLEAPTDGKWSGRATVGFVLVVCGGFWAGAVFAAKLLLLH